MTTRLWDDDDSLLRDLAAALGPADELPARLRRTAEGAFCWRDIDEDLELATLMYDSLVESASTMRLPGQDTYRTLLFECESTSVQLERTGDTVVGQVIPPAAGRIAVEGADGYRDETEVDELGCFGFDEVPTEPIRLRWDAPPVRLVTDWVQL